MQDPVNNSKILPSVSSVFNIDEHPSPGLANTICPVILKTRGPLDSEDGELNVNSYGSINRSE